MGRGNRIGPRGLLACRDGSSAVEFALVSPVLIFMFLGMLLWGLYLGIAHGVQEAAAFGARAAVGGVSPDERTSIATAAVRASVAGNPLLDPAALTVAVAPSGSDPDTLVVTLRYDLTRSPVAAAPRMVTLPTTLVRTASVRRGGL